VAKDHLARLKAAGWTARAYRPGDEAQLLPLYPLAFQGLQRSPAYWAWKFRENPAGDELIVVEEAGGAIVGLLAGLHARVHVAGRLATFSQATDIMVDPRLRRGLRRAGLYIGMVAAFMDAAQANGVALLFGLPNQDSDRVSQAVFGWQNLHQVTRVVRRVEGAERPAAGFLARLRYEVRPVERLDGGIEDLWERCCPALRLATVRDGRYLDWRYLRCPHVGYRVCVAWDRWRSRAAGLAVLRFGWEGQPLCGIVDWLVPRGESGAAAALLTYAIGEARRAGMAEVAAWFPPEGAEQHWFLARGFTAEPTRYPLVARALAPDLALDWVARHWYYTMGDSDIF